MEHQLALPTLIVAGAWLAAGYASEAMPAAAAKIVLARLTWERI
jgi:hypothetical protein